MIINYESGIYYYPESYPDISSNLFDYIKKMISYIIDVSVLKELRVNTHVIGSKGKSFQSDVLKEIPKTDLLIYLAYNTADEMNSTDLLDFRINQLKPIENNFDNMAVMYYQNFCKPHLFNVYHVMNDIRSLGLKRCRHASSDYIQTPDIINEWMDVFIGKHSNHKLDINFSLCPDIPGRTMVVIGNTIIITPLGWSMGYTGADDISSMQLYRKIIVDHFMRLVLMENAYMIKPMNRIIDMSVKSVIGKTIENKIGVAKRQSEYKVETVKKAYELRISELKREHELEMEALLDKRGFVIQDAVLKLGRLNAYISGNKLVVPLDVKIYEGYLSHGFQKPLGYSENVKVKLKTGAHLAYIEYMTFDMISSTLRVELKGYHPNAGPFRSDIFSPYYSLKGFLMRDTDDVLIKCNIHRYYDYICLGDLSGAKNTVENILNVLNTFLYPDMHHTGYCLEKDDQCAYDAGYARCKARGENGICEKNCEYSWSQKIYEVVSSEEDLNWNVKNQKGA